jgi:uncharacterized protein YndB with AHSA1/START domain
MTMTEMTSNSDTDRPVRQSITVRADLERTFRVFTAEFDSWWPRSHHIGTSPMTKSIIEGKVGGRCYSEQESGEDCPWGTVLAWDPPRSFTFAWQITPEWKFEPDLAKSSEVEVTFTPLGDKSTRVDLEHRNFSRHGAGGDAMREGVGGPGGWASLLEIFAAKATTI